MEVVLPGRRQITYLGESFTQSELGAGRKLYKLTIKLNSSKTIFRDFANTVRELSTDQFWKSMYCITQKNADFWNRIQVLS